MGIVTLNELPTAASTYPYLPVPSCRTLPLSRILFAPCSACQPVSAKPTCQRVAHPNGSRPPPRHDADARRRWRRCRRRRRPQPQRKRPDPRPRSPRCRHGRLAFRPTRVPLPACERALLQPLQHVSCRHVESRPQLGEVAQGSSCGGPSRARAHTCQSVSNDSVRS